MVSLSNHARLVCGAFYKVVYFCQVYLILISFSICHLAHDNGYVGSSIRDGIDKTITDVHIPGLAGYKRKRRNGVVKSQCGWNHTFADG